MGAFISSIPIRLTNRPSWLRSSLSENLFWLKYSVLYIALQDMKTFENQAKKRYHLLVTLLLWKVDIFAQNIWHIKITELFPKPHFHEIKLFLDLFFTYKKIMIFLQPDSLDSKLQCRRIPFGKYYLFLKKKNLLSEQRCSSWESIDENFTEKNQFWK